ncbi:MAG: hypothetical protein HKN51_06080 [Saprospiraceae bacterium]|nr:hypothetical protein [Saprospiraceae bacterium]
MPKETVIFNHDAAIDEFMAAVLLTTMEDINFEGSVIMNADCIYNFAMQAQWKIQSYLNISPETYPITLSRARQWNSFPWLYREDCIKENNIECLKDIPNNPNWPCYPNGDDLMRQKLQNAYDNDQQITVLVNCPMTTLRNILEDAPHLCDAISRLIWMGGAINVAGNLDPTTIPKEVANPKAEWNAFCDPYAIDWVFKNTTFPIIVFPLDVTDQAAITQSFMDKLQAQSADSLYSNLAFQSYSLVAQESFYDMWDVLTTCYIPHPEFFETPTNMNLKIITEDYWQGTLIHGDGGRAVQVALNLIDPDGFYNYVLQQFNR